MANIDILFLENISNQNTRILEKILSSKYLNQHCQVLEMFTRVGILSSHHIKNTIDMACALDSCELFMIYTRYKYHIELCYKGRNNIVDFILELYLHDVLSEAIRGIWNRILRIKLLKNVDVLRPTSLPEILKY